MAVELFSSKLSVDGKKGISEDEQTSAHDRSIFRSGVCYVLLYTKGFAALRFFFEPSRKLLVS